MTTVVNSADAPYLLRSLFSVAWLCRMARLHGRLTYLTRRGDTATVRRNIESVFGGTRSAGEIETLTRQFFEYKRVRGVLLAMSPRLSQDEMERVVAIEGLEHLDAALSEKRGVILLGSHLNSLSGFLATVFLRRRGYDVQAAIPENRDPWPTSALGRAMARRFKTQPVTELIGAFYAQFNIRPIVRRLADNVIVTQTGDGLHAARFVRVEFLGRQVPFPTGMESVAQLTGAVVVPMFTVGPPDRLRIILEEPWMVERDGNGDAALRDRVAAYARRLEHHLVTNIPCWEHWLIEDTLTTIATWPERPLRERYEV